METEEKKDNQGHNPNEKPEKNTLSATAPVRFLVTFLFFFLFLQLAFILLGGIAPQVIENSEYVSECPQESANTLNAINDTGLVSYEETDLKIFGSENSVNGYIKLSPQQQCETDYFYGETTLNNNDAQQTLEANEWQIKTDTKTPLLLIATKEIDDTQWTVEKSKSKNSNNIYSFKLYVD